MVDIDPSCLLDSSTLSLLEPFPESLWDQLTRSTFSGFLDELSPRQVAETEKVHAQNRFPNTPQESGDANMESMNIDNDIAQPTSSVHQTKSPMSFDTWEPLPRIRSPSRSPRLPRIAKLTPTPRPILTFTEAMRSRLLQDLEARVGSTYLCKSPIPSASILEKCLRAYFDAFHIHFPLLHIPTMDLEHTPSVLILAICAIGALYRLQRRTASLLYIHASNALSLADGNPASTVFRPDCFETWTTPQISQGSKGLCEIWISQSRLLLTMLGAFNGDPSIAKKAIQDFGCLVTVCHPFLVFIFPEINRSRLKD
jgi:hypothetical protein